ncbi:MAG: hypothetical protein C5S38_00305 [Candidatus Methanophagaceae archaeon]|nr:MAG: hypothetical protein C5S38_00305 [Methanophagales archaeon]KAF5432083.1 hypothetical protein C5S36_09225 [Methanophagales archaeon]
MSLKGYEKDGNQFLLGHNTHSCAIRNKNISSLIVPT